VEVGILGPLEVEVDGVRVEVGGARLRALLTRLAADPGRVVGLDALVDALWADQPPADRGNAVQTLVSRLRRTVPGAQVVSTQGGYRLDDATVDAQRFEELARAGRDALRLGDPAAAAPVLADALALWRGPAYVDAGEARYAVAAAARLDELRVAATEDRIEAELALGRATAPAAELEELAREHPLRERLWALRLQALAAAGRPAEALAAYEEFRRRLADELGADPSPELRAAHLAVLRGEADAPGPRRGNLRAALSSFVGRDEELRQLTKQLAENRLVTLVGPGGAGKTRLASVAAAALADTVGGGAWLVELAPVTDPAEVPRAVLETVGVRRTDDPRPRDTMGRLVDTFSEAETLLVLDNCEHVVDAAARLADELLARCPRLRILATSRESLGIVGEALNPVPPLRLPAPDASAADALAYPSVQLLRDRAAAVRPGFAVTDDNVRSIVEICRRLDGLPLAIELAAARLRALSPEQVAAGLDDRFRLLTGGARTALPRHRTLRAVVAWSWDLLTADERRLADVLAVFPSTITAESAAAVAGGAAGLDGLVDKSLLQVVDDGRFRMLETIREYGLERLAEVGEVADAQAAHAAYYLHLVETAEPHLRTANQLPWLRLLKAERENINGALHFACDAEDADTALRIGAGLMLPLAIWGDRGQPTNALDRALALPEPGPPAERAIVMAVRLMAQVFAGNGLPTAHQVAELATAIDAAQASSNPYVSLLRPMLTLFTDDTEAGLTAIAGLVPHPDPWINGVLLAMRGQIEENSGDAEGMLRDLTDAVRQLRPVGERWALSMALTSYADALTKRGRFDEATATLRESLRLSHELDPTDETAFQVIWLATMKAIGGDVQSAKDDLARFIAERPGDADGRDTSFALMVLGDIMRRTGDLDGAEKSFAEAWRRQDRAPMVAPQFRGLLQAGRAHLALAVGDVDEARARAVDAMEHALGGRDMPVVATVALTVVALDAATGEPERAARTLGAADSIRGHPDWSSHDAERLEHDLRATLGDAGYEEAYAAGRALERADALALVDPSRPR
jgi:predicted ATPase/DNA-binding SARP family transcriptional activator